VSGVSGSATFFHMLAQTRELSAGYRPGCHRQPGVLGTGGYGVGPGVGPGPGVTTPPERAKVGMTPVQPQPPAGRVLSSVQVQVRARVRGDVSRATVRGSSRSAQSATTGSGGTVLVHPHFGPAAACPQPTAPRPPVGAPTASVSRPGVILAR
jgi:hypothetical protein